MVENVNGDTFDGLGSRVIFDGKSFTLYGVHVDDHIYRMLRNTGSFYEEELLRSTRSLVHAGDFVIDAGANIGNHAVFWAGVSGARVLAIEPADVTCSALRRSVAANGLDDSVYIGQYGVGAVASRGTVNPVDFGNVGMTSITVDGHGAVQVFPIDELPEVAENRVRLLKVDVEGMELDVLRGAHQTIRRDLPALLVECLTEKHFVAVFALLEPLGYQMVECFNASPTYMFLHRSWDFAEVGSKADYLLEVVGRTARRSILNRIEYQKLKREIGKLNERMDALERAASSRATGGSGHGGDSA